MSSLGVYVFLAIIYLGGYRGLGFLRRCKQKHRLHLLSLGYREKAPKARLRGERRGRIAGIVYVAISGSLTVFFPGLIFARGANQFGVMLFSLILASFPSLAVRWGMMFFEESRIVDGVLERTMAFNEFIKVGKPLDPSQGNLGSAAIVDPAAAGFTNPFALLARPSIDEYEKVAA